ncbi:hypothetical protein HDU97_008397 [Phlyctochytrium planicorne]|nr:hypothetical protein HDU97_008397 [Phlyctochytrium planicorne]
MSDPISPHELSAITFKPIIMQEDEHVSCQALMQADEGVLLAGGGKAVVSSTSNSVTANSTPTIQPIPITDIPSAPPAFPIIASSSNTGALGGNNSNGESMDVDISTGSTHLDSASIPPSSPSQEQQDSAPSGPVKLSTDLILNSLFNDSVIKTIAPETAATKAPEEPEEPEDTSSARSRPFTFSGYDRSLKKSLPLTGPSTQEAQTPTPTPDTTSPHKPRIVLKLSLTESEAKQNPPLPPPAALPQVLASFQSDWHLDDSEVAKAFKDVNNFKKPVNLKWKDLTGKVTIKGMQRRSAGAADNDGQAGSFHTLPTPFHDVIPTAPPARDVDLITALDVAATAVSGAPRSSTTNGSSSTSRASPSSEAEDDATSSTSSTVTPPKTTIHSEIDISKTNMSKLEMAKTTPKATKGPKRLAEEIEVGVEPCREIEPDKIPLIGDNSMLEPESPMTRSRPPKEPKEEPKPTEPKQRKENVAKEPMTLKESKERAKPLEAKDLGINPEQLEDVVALHSALNGPKEPTSKRGRGRPRKQPGEGRLTMDSKRSAMASEVPPTAEQGTSSSAVGEKKMDDLYNIDVNGIRRLKHKRVVKTKNHIPRPPNAFILYRITMQREHQDRMKENNLNSKDMSNVWAARWKLEPDHVKQKFQQQAKEARDKLVAEHPEFSFKPWKKKATVWSETAKGLTRKSNKPSEDMADSEDNGDDVGSSISSAPAVLLDQYSREGSSQQMDISSPAATSMLDLSRIAEEKKRKKREQDAGIEEVDATGEGVEPVKKRRKSKGDDGEKTPKPKKEKILKEDKPKRIYRYRALRDPNHKSRSKEEMAESARAIAKGLPAFLVMPSSLKELEEEMEAEGEYPREEEIPSMVVLGVVEVVENGQIADAARRGGLRLKEAIEKGNLQDIVDTSHFINYTLDSPDATLIRYIPSHPVLPSKPLPSFETLAELNLTIKYLQPTNCVLMQHRGQDLGSVWKESCEWVAAESGDTFLSGGGLPVESFCPSLEREVMETGKEWKIQSRLPVDPAGWFAYVVRKS